MAASLASPRGHRRQRQGSTGGSPRSRRASLPQRIRRRPEEPRAAARKPRPLAEVPLGHVIAFPAPNWRRGERAVSTGPRAEVTPGGGVGRGVPGESKMADKEKKKKESILDLSKYIDKTIRVKFQGGREASGVLKGFDPLLNLVLDGTVEYMRDPDDQYKLTEDTRQLGLVVCRGTSVVLICPQDGMEAIPNPFIQQQDG
ncbi:U6 snRNA-associated Sm-like protein LSm7 [Crotalus tigris]|nr:U6 snRNA-associated Sm-like protein LSm7 [Crotalus tigris]